MRVAIYDKGGGDFKTAAQQAAVTVLGSESVPAFDPPSDQAVERMREFTHIVCHLRSDRDKTTGALVDPSWPKLVDRDADLSRVKAIIRVSSQGASGMSDSFRCPYRHNDKGPWILHLIEPSGSVTNDRWKAIFQAVKAWDTSWGELPADVRSIFAPNSDRLALRLLCEAWIATQGKRSTIIETIAVNAPTDRASWLLPFDVDDNPASVEQFATRLGTTEDMQRDILAVLEASGAGTLTWDDSHTLVQRLSGALKKAAR